MGRLFLLFTLLPLAELVVLIQVGGRIGAMTTILIVVCTAWVGAVLARREGLRVYADFQSQIKSGQLPGVAILEGVLVLASALTLITPGFITDSVGLLLLLPQVRKAVVLKLKKHYADRIMVKQGIIDIDDNNIDV